MFCEKCGKELEDGWKKCPYCGQVIGEGSVKAEKKPETSNHPQTVQRERNYIEDVPKKKGKAKKVLLWVGAVLLLLIVVAILTPSGDDSSNSSQGTKEASEEIKTLEEVGGFGQWKEEGFPGMVRANISVEFPLGNTDKNKYAVYIGMGGVNIGIVMQEDEKPVKEWEWLINAEPYEETGKAYFNGILKYLREDDEVPVFLVSDVTEGDYKADSQDMGNEEVGYTEIDLEEIMGLPEKELEGMGFSYDEDNMGYTLAGGGILVNSDMDGNVNMIMIEGTGSDMPGFHGIRIGMSLEEADKLLADRYTKEGEREGVTMDDTAAYLDRKSGNSVMLSNVDGKITQIYVMHHTEEELQETLNPENAENMEMYLTNSSESIPVKIENLYQETVYTGFTTVSFDMVNVTDTDIKKAKFGIAAWDSYKLPLELVEMYSFDPEYFYRCQGSNIAAGQTSHASVSFEQRDFKYMQILLLECIDFEGNTWTNPAASYYEENFAGKKFDENTMTAMVFDTDENDMSGDMEGQEDVVNCTGDFFTDVSDGVLYEKDGVIVDVNGNALAEYSEYYVTEDGYISNGDWVEEGYTVDDTGKIVQF